MRDFDSEQFSHFEKVENDRFNWQTLNSFISSKEKEVLNSLSYEPGERALEVGCGEGANIVNLGSEGKIIGLDYSYNRVKFAKDQIKGKTDFICASATDLPFSSGSFDLVFCRDLLHHLSDKKKAILEMSRVCKENGRVAIIEMNGKSNLVGRIFSRLVKEESGMRDLDVNELISFLKDAGAKEVNLAMRQPCLLYRVIFHYKLCFVWMTKYRLCTNFIEWLEKLTTQMTPKNNWGYIIISGRKLT